MFCLSSKWINNPSVVNIDAFIPDFFIESFFLRACAEHSRRLHVSSKRVGQRLDAAEVNICDKTWSQTAASPLSVSVYRKITLNPDQTRTKYHFLQVLLLWKNECDWSCVPLFLTFTVDWKQKQPNSNRISFLLVREKNRMVINFWKCLFMRIWINTPSVVGFAASQLRPGNDLNAVRRPNIATTLEWFLNLYLVLTSGWGKSPVHRKYRVAMTTRAGTFEEKKKLKQRSVQTSGINHNFGHQTSR